MACRQCIKKNMQKRILDDIALNLKDFEEQAKIKLFKRSHLLNTKTDHLELISDIIDSIVNKFDNEITLRRFYYMAIHDKLRLYIFKAIDTNCSSYSAPFLQKKLKNKKIYPLIENLNIQDEGYDGMDSDQIKYYELPEEKRLIVDKVYLMLEPVRAKELFGDHWKYFANLFLEYIDDPKATYRSIGKKYDVPATSIGSHIQIVKNKIKKELDENN